MLQRKIEQALMDWKNTPSHKPLIVKGCRQCGKTYSVVDFAKKNYEHVVYLNFFENPQYASVFSGSLEVDHITMMLSALMGRDAIFEPGKTILVLDEIHKYAGWSRELKQIYDMHPSLNLIFTGSSVLDIKKGEADLSRRALMYMMQGLSFREYLQLFKGIKTRVFSLDEILNHQVEIPGLEHPLPVFRAYLDHGYYPFAIEGDFMQRMLQVIDQTVEVDIPQYADMKASTARKLKRMLVILSGLAPYKPSVENLATEIGVSKNNVPDYLVYLERAGMIGLLRDDTSGMRNLGKVEKVYVDNPSLMSVLTPNPNIGNIRETFFYNQMREKQDVTSSRVSDFTIGDYTFEIGGKKKGKKQIEDVKNGRIVKDDIETGHGIIIPLWYFGMNY